MTSIVWYSSSGEEDPPRYPLEVPDLTCITRPIEAREIAELAAEDFHSEHDGWESRWPRDVTLYETKDGPPIASFEVERMARPDFFARRKESIGA